MKQNHLVKVRTSSKIKKLSSGLDIQSRKTATRILLNRYDSSAPFIKDELLNFIGMKDFY